jgi:hypothetical protein
MKRFVLLLALALALAAPAAAQSPVYREDTPHTSGHYGSLFFCVRQDTAAALAANGDYIPCIVDPVGRLWTSAVQSGAWTVAATQSGGWTVTANAGTGTFATDPTDDDARVLGRTKIHDGTDTALVSGTGSLQVTCDNCGAPAGFADNSAFTFGTTGISNVGFVFDDVATNTVTENSAAAARITTNRAIHVNLRNNTGTEVAPLTDTQLRATPVPVSGTVTVTDGAGSMNVIVDSGTVAATQSGTWNVTNISGTVSLPTGASTSANQSTEITSLQKIDNIAHAGSDVALSEHVPISGQLDDTGTTTVTENQVAPVRITAGRALHVAQQGTATVSGTVTANQGGTWTVQPGNTPNTTPWLASIHDGTTKASVADLTNSNPLHTAIVDGSGNQITSFGGGTQYTEGDTDATITGTALLWEDTSDTLRVASVAKPIPMRIGDGTDQVLVSGGGSLQVTCDNCGGASPFEDEDAFTPGTSSVGTVGYLVDEVAPDSAPEGSSAAPRMSLNRVPYAQLRDAAGNERGANVTAGNALVVDGSASTQPVSGTVTVTDGAGALNVIVDSGSVTVSDGAGALNTIIDSGTVTANQGGAPWSVAGPAADGAAVSGNPVRIGGKDGSGNTQDVATDTSGELQVDVLTLPSVTIGTFPDNEPVNVAQMNGIAVTMGNGAAGTGVQRVTLADDSTGEVRIADNAGNQIESATAAPAASARGLIVRQVGACTNELKTFFPVDIVTATTVLVATGVGGQHVYICSLALVTALANNVAIVAGTGATCGTSTAGMLGGATAAEGLNLAANGGITLGSGSGSVARTESTGDSVCIITSAATQLSGVIGYVIE